MIYSKTLMNRNSQIRKDTLLDLRIRYSAFGGLVSFIELHMTDIHKLTSMLVYYTVVATTP